MESLEHKEFIIDQYGKILNEKSPYVKSQILYNLISIKCSDIVALGNIRQSLYIDIKWFIELYTNAVDDKAYGYDTFALNKIFDIYSHLDPKEALSINQYLLRMLKSKGFEDECEKCKSESVKLLARKFKQSNIVIYLLNTLLYETSKGTKRLLITILLILGLFCVILLPSPIEGYYLFEITYDKISDGFLVNHIINLINSSLGISNDFEIRPTGIFGATLLIGGKVILIVIIGNYLLQEVYRKINA